jgi:hypothetical protein
LWVKYSPRGGVLNPFGTNKIDFIITRNTEDYKKSIIPVYTPSEFLNIMEIKKGNGA